MTHRRRLTRLPFVILPLAMLVLAGCPFSPNKDNKPPDPTPSNYLPQTSIANVLANLKTSYKEKNYDEYRKLLDTTYEYIFAPVDIGGPNNIPASWGLPDELVATENMFNRAPNRDGYWAEEIALDFTQGAPTDTELNPTWKKVILSNVQLNITGRNEASDVMIYMVSGDQADLYFVQTEETDSTSGLPIWKIVRWEDKPHVAMAIAAKL